MQHPNRPLLEQRYLPFALLVGVKATPLNTGWQQASLSGLYDSFILSLPKTAANPVYMGDASISPAKFNGLEILPGVPIQLSISNERQLYEVQAPLADPDCQIPESIPFICWNPATIYFAAVAPTIMGVILFNAPYL